MGPAMPLDPNPLVLRAETLVAERETRKAEKMTRTARGKSAEVGKLNWLLQQMTTCYYTLICTNKIWKN